MRELTPSERATSCGLIANIGACCDVTEGQLFDEGTFPGLTPARQMIALDNAATTLNMLTAGRAANCPVTVRPCALSCMSPMTSWSWQGSSWTPHIDGLGNWVNTCSCSTECDCRASHWLDLGPVAEIISVDINGQILDESEYRVAAGLLVRNEGQWPERQDMDAPPGSPDTFTVTYRRGVPLGPQGEWALGLLACEYARSACGQKCSLPKNVTEISRRGVTMQIARDLFTDGLTGIREVDLFIQSVNPLGIRVLSGISSPDVERIR